MLAQWRWQYWHRVMVHFRVFLMDLVLLGSCDVAASECFNIIGFVIVNTTAVGFGNHGSPMGFANEAAISIKIDWSMQ